ncbi:MAG: class I SAM-dependent methyltransferase [Agriterribacter sp.]
MTEFWEEAFKDKQEMWGLSPTNSAIATAEMFQSKGLKEILIPGIGYGRNAQAFWSKGMKVTGIEISKTAIQLAKKHYGAALKIYHGSVTNMPFDNERYEGIFSYALIHLLNENERTTFIKNCYDQLCDNGYMVFTAISKKAQTYGQGTLVSKDRYEQSGGVKIFFYDEISIQNEFGNFGFMEATEVPESHAMYLIKCCKKSR